MIRGRSIAVLMAVVLAPSRANAGPAPDVDACIAGFEEGQRARATRSFHRALEKLAVCTEVACPAVLRADCAGLVQEIQLSIPSVVFEAKDSDGRELTDVRVFDAGRVLVERLDGSVIEVDPGYHRFRFERSGSAPTIVEYDAQVATKNQVVPAVIEVVKVRSTAGYAVPIAFAGLSAAGFIAAGALKLGFDNRADELRSQSCASSRTCSASAVDDAIDHYLIPANVSLGIAFGSLALAAVSFWLLAPQSQNVPRSSSQRLPPTAAWSR